MYYTGLIFKDKHYLTCCLLVVVGMWETPSVSHIPTTFFFFASFFFLPAPPFYVNKCVGSMAVWPKAYLFAISGDRFSIVFSIYLLVHVPGMVSGNHSCHGALIRCRL